MKIWLLGILILLLALSVRFYYFFEERKVYEDGQSLTFTTTLTSQPRIVGNQQIFTANLSSGERVRVVTGRFPEFDYGDHLEINGSVHVPEGESNQKGRLLNINSILMSMYFPEIKKTEESGGILRAIGNLRERIISILERTLPSPSSGLLMGIIFGIKESMPESFSDNLKTSGVFHVVAASGMNVTLIGGFFSSFFAIFFKRQIAICLSILGILFYAVLGGLEPSIIRASIMGILVFSAQIIGRQTLAVNGLILAGFTMLFISPNIILDIGFQLSFMATLGILYIKTPLDQHKALKPILKRFGIVSDVFTTVSAQLATLPILLANFGMYSLYSILVNALVLWTIPLIMAIGGIGVLVGLIIFPLGQLIIYVSYPLLFYFESVVNFFGAIGGMITIQSLSWQFIVGYYLTLSSVFVFLRNKKPVL